MTTRGMSRKEAEERLAEDWELCSKGAMKAKHAYVVVDSVLQDGSSEDCVLQDGSSEDCVLQDGSSEYCVLQDASSEDSVEGREINEEKMCRGRGADSDKKRESVVVLSSDGTKNDICVVTSGDGLCLPVIGEGKGLEELVKETMFDPSLATWRELATTNDQGFHWKNGMILNKEIDEFGIQRDVLVVPSKFRRKVLTIAHIKCGHFAIIKVKALVRKKFLWPLVSSDIHKFCKICNTCQTMNKAQTRSYGKEENCHNSF